MNTNVVMDFSINKENHTIIVKREFAAPLPLVWKAFTTSKILDNWWAPHPWKAETKLMSFKEGGQWLYAMVGPNGQKHWSFAKYQSIKNEQEYVATDGFSNENGIIDKSKPQSRWNVKFSTVEKNSLVDMEITFTNSEQLESIIKMGFKEGFTMGLSNLDVYFTLQN